MTWDLDFETVRWIKKITWLDHSISIHDRGLDHIVGEYIDKSRYDGELNFDANSLYLVCYRGFGMKITHGLYVLLYTDCDCDIQIWRTEKLKDYVSCGDKYRAHIYDCPTVDGAINVIWNLVEDWLIDESKRIMMDDEEDELSIDKGEQCIFTIESLNAIRSEILVVCSALETLGALDERWREFVDLRVIE